MLKINKKKIKPYGDRLDDGCIQLSFTLPLPASPEAKEAAKRYIEKLGLQNVSISTMQSMGDDFSFFVVYGNAKHTIDFMKIRVPKVEADFMDYKALTDYMEAHFEKPIVVVGGAIGTDAHTVGIDAIMNMKGFAGDYGLERYPLFKAYNLRSQISNEALIEKAVELKADVILISQVVTQRDSHLKNLKSFRKLASEDKRLSKEVLLVVGGPRLDHAMALKLGYDAGFGPGTKPSQVASFVIKEIMKRRGIERKSVVRKDDAKVDESKKSAAKTSKKRHFSHKKRTEGPSGKNYKGKRRSRSNVEKGQANAQKGKE